MGIKIGLIGAGRMGQVYGQILSYNVIEADLVAIADLNYELAQSVAKQFGIRNSYCDYQDLLNDNQIEAVVIATSTNTHVNVIKDAARAGKKIFCEKPLALTIQDCKTAIQEVDQSKSFLMVGFMRRFDPSYVKAKKMIDDGVIGTPVMYKGVGRDPNRPGLEFAKRSISGGLIMDMGIHDFDLARWLMGSEVDRVYTEGGCLVFPELNEVGDIDNAVINMKFKNGAIGNIDVSRNAIYGYDIRTEVLGSKGALIINHEKKSDTVVYIINGVIHDTIPFFMERFPEAYAAEIREFTQTIVDGRKPMVSGEDALAATAIGMAATLSLDEKRPVLISEIL